MLLYDITYYSADWGRQLKAFDSATTLSPLSPHDRAYARCVNDHDWPMHWNGSQWAQGTPRELQERFDWRARYDLFSRQIAGVRPYELKGKGSTDHTRVGQHVLLRRTDETFDPVLAQVEEVLHTGDMRCWLPEFEISLLVSSQSLF